MTGWDTESPGHFDQELVDAGIAYPRIPLLGEDHASVALERDQTESLFF